MICLFFTFLKKSARKLLGPGGEMVYTLVLGTSAVKSVEVRVLSWAPQFSSELVPLKAWIVLCTSFARTSPLIRTFRVFVMRSIFVSFTTPKSVSFPYCSNFAKLNTWSFYSYLFYWVLLS